MVRSVGKTMRTFYSGNDLIEAPSNWGALSLCLQGLFRMYAVSRKFFYPLSTGCPLFAGSLPQPSPPDSLSDPLLPDPASFPSQSPDGYDPDSPIWLSFSFWQSSLTHHPHPARPLSPSKNDAVAAKPIPLQLVKVLHKLRPERIEMDISYQLQKVSIFLAQNRFVPVPQTPQTPHGPWIRWRQGV
jgi:hypothetical protein